MKRGMIAGVGEKMQYLVHEQNDNTVRFGLCYPRQLDPQILGQAVLALVSSVDILHSSFRPGNLEAFWLVNEKYDLGDCFRVIQSGDDQEPGELESLARQAMLRPIATDSKVQLFCTLILGKGESWVVLKLSHLCVDGSDARYLLEKLMEGYRLIGENGSAAGLAVKNGSRSAFQVYKELSRKEYLSAVKPNLSGIKTGFPFPEVGTGEPRIVVHRLSSELVTAARLRGKELGATANDILLTACYRAFASLPGMEPRAPISIMSMMDLRRHCKGGESDGLCNMSGSLPTVLEQGVSGDFTDTLAEIRRQTRRVKEDPIAGLYGLPVLHTMTRTMPLWLLMKAASRVYGAMMSTGLTNMGVISYDLLSVEGQAPKFGLFAGPMKRKPGMQISAAGFGGDITLCCVGEFGAEDAGRVQLLFDMMEEELRQFI